MQQSVVGEGRKWTSTGIPFDVQVPGETLHAAPAPGPALAMPGPTEPAVACPDPSLQASQSCGPDGHPAICRWHGPDRLQGGHPPRSRWQLHPTLPAGTPGSPPAAARRPRHPHTGRAGQWPGIPATCTKVGLSQAGGRPASTRHAGKRQRCLAGLEGWEAILDGRHDFAGPAHDAGHDGAQGGDDPCHVLAIASPTIAGPRPIVGQTAGNLLTRPGPARWS